MSDERYQSDGVWRRAEPESPCVKLCVVDPKTRTCMGCGRTPDEIAAWPTMTPEARRAVMDGLPARMAAAAPKRGDARRRRRRPSPDGGTPV